MNFNIKISWFWLVKKTHQEPKRLELSAMEGLSKMLEKARQLNWIQGFRVGSITCNQVIISHLSYVDDTLIFCEADRSQTLYLNLTLLLFEALSGWHINKLKSIVYPVNTGSQYWWVGWNPRVQHWDTDLFLFGSSFGSQIHKLWYLEWTMEKWRNLTKDLLHGSCNIYQVGVD